MKIARTFTVPLRGTGKADYSQEVPIQADFERIYTAIRVMDEDADVHVVVDETLGPGVSGWMELPVAAGRLGCQRFGTEWGDPVVKLKWAIDDMAKVACKEHFVAPTPTPFEFAKYWEKHERLWLYRENTDAVNSAEYHLSILAVMPLTSDWAKWRAKIRKVARSLLE